MAEWTTGAAILAQASGSAAPGTAPDIEWSDACAAAVNAGLDTRLVGASYGEAPLPPELTRAALVAGVIAYKAREANVDASAPAVVGDYLETIAPIIARYATLGIA